MFTVYLHDLMMHRPLLNSIRPSSLVVRGLKRPALNTSQLTEGRRTGALAMKVMWND